jgi:hypothetical protein
MHITLCVGIVCRFRNIPTDHTGHVFMMTPHTPKISSCREHLRSCQSLAQPEESLGILPLFLPFSLDVQCRLQRGRGSTKGGQAEGRDEKEIAELSLRIIS